MREREVNKKQKLISPAALLSQNNLFYQRYYQYVLMSIMVLIVLLVVALGMLFYQLRHRPLPIFYAQTPTGSSMSLTVFNEPNLLPDTILKWASTGATLAYTFDFLNYNKQIAAARPFFTAEGWQEYLASVRSLVSTIVQNQLFVYGVVSGTPVISNQGSMPRQGYVWRAQIPFLVTYESANATTTQNFIVVVTIVRVPTYLNPQGIGIDQFVMVSV